VTYEGFHKGTTKNDVRDKQGSLRRDYDTLT